MLLPTRSGICSPKSDVPQRFGKPARKTTSRKPNRLWHAGDTTPARPDHWRAAALRRLNHEGFSGLLGYWTNACKTCPLKSKCTPSPQRRIKRWVHEDVLERAQARLDKNPNAMRTRRETVEHPFGTLKMRMGATHFLCVTLPKVATEMALCVLGYNLTRVLNIVGMKPLLAAVRA